MSASAPRIQQLLPPALFPPADMSDQDLARCYAYPPEHGGGVFIRANMVSTVDGAAAGENGLSGTINNAPDFRVFRVLRSLAQVVLVGAGTARNEGYSKITAPSDLVDLRTQSGVFKDLEFAVISRSGELPSRTLQGPDGGPEPIVFTTAPGQRKLIEQHGNVRSIVAETGGNVDLAKVKESLRELGLHRVLTEGGPSILAQFIDQKLLNELCLTTVNVLQPGESLGITSHSALKAAAHTTQLASLLNSESTLLARWNLNTDQALTQHLVTANPRELV